MDMNEALQVIIATSPVAAGEAFRCIRAIRAGSRMVPERFNRVAEIALTDPEATFTPDQRNAISALIDVRDVESRTEWFRMRVTAAELAAIRESADAEGMSMSEWARQKLLPLTH